MYSQATNLKEISTLTALKFKSYGDIRRENDDIIVLTAFGTNRREVTDNIKRIAGECELYAPDIPVYGNTLFNTDYYRAHIKDLEFVRNRLNDDYSKKVFDCIVNFKLTGDITYLFDCECDKSEPFENILKLNKDEIFMDLGAYRADTVLEFLKYAGGCKKIYAVEPDGKTFVKLKQKLDCKSDSGDIICINAAAGACEGSSGFEAGKRQKLASVRQGTTGAGCDRRRYFRRTVCNIHKI